MTSQIISFFDHLYSVFEIPIHTPDRSWDCIFLVLCLVRLHWFQNEGPGFVENFRPTHNIGQTIVAAPSFCLHIILFSNFFIFWCDFYNDFRGPYMLKIAKYPRKLILLTSQKWHQNKPFFRLTISMTHIFTINFSHFFFFA